MSEKKKFKFNVIDAVVVVVIVAALCFAGYKLAIEPNSKVNLQQNTYTVSFFCEEVPTFAAEAIQVGDPVSDEQKDVPLGEVISVKIGPIVAMVEASIGLVREAPSISKYLQPNITNKATINIEPKSLSDTR